MNDVPSYRSDGQTSLPPMNDFVGRFLGRRDLACGLLYDSVASAVFARRRCRVFASSDFLRIFFFCIAGRILSAFWEMQRGQGAYLTKARDHLSR